MRIYLIGFMGSGKTTIGKQLAARLGFRFMDMDKEIQNHFGLTVSKIFKAFGESKFREAEHALIEQTLSMDQIVISTGGGAPCFSNNMQLMNASGLTIYLKTNPQTLCHRLKGSQKDRPLLQKKTDTELLDYVKEKLSEREPYYLKAKFIIEAIDIKVNDLLAVLPNRQF